MKIIKSNFILFAAIFCIFASCSKDKDEPTVIPPEKPVNTIVPDYIKFVKSSVHNITVTENSTNEYQLQTTGDDPYISSSALKKANDPDSVVLTFEYQCSVELINFKLYFANPLSEERAQTIGNLPASSQWTTYSVNLSTCIKKYSWGKVGDYLRFDIGDVAGISLKIKNVFFRKMSDEERKAQEQEENEKQEELQAQEDIKNYISKKYDCSITKVIADDNNISIKGNINGENMYYLCEITPYEDLTKIKTFDYQVEIKDKSFDINIERYITRDGFKYDRILSKWVIIKKGGTDEIASHARYVDKIEVPNSPAEMKTLSKKGLGGFFLNQIESDLDDLGITSITVNIPITSYIRLTPTNNNIIYPYGGKNYYFDENKVLQLDKTLQAAQKRNIVVAAIILVQKASECIDPNVGALLQYSSYTSEGNYTMPNLTTAESVNCYAAALDFFANRYCEESQTHGRIHHWIMHNEVDMSSEWTNMGDKPIYIYMDAYIKSLRMCYNIARKYDNNSEVLASFTHSWTSSSGTKGYTTKEMINILENYGNAEGDFQWGLAYHSYPQDLTEPKTWLDDKATFSTNTPFVTFKNLEVLDNWAKQPENKYLGNTKRLIWLSENGLNSKTYSDKDLKEQAAGFAFAWKKINALDGIDAIQWHNWIDNRVEYGLRIGLRRFSDDENDPLGKKPVWYLYQSAGTDQENTLFDPYKSIIGINDWNILQTVN